MMLTTLITIGGVLFWTFLAFILVIEIWLLSFDHPSEGAILVLTTALLLLYAFTDFYAIVNNNWYNVSVLVGLYVVFGIGWSVIKWRQFLWHNRDIIHERWTNRGPLQSPVTWAEYAKEQRPTAIENKQRITNWIALWPFSFLYWLLGVPLRWANRVFDWLRNMYDRMAERVFE